MAIERGFDVTSGSDESPFISNSKANNPSPSSPTNKSPFKKILSKGDVNINSTRDSYSEKSFNEIRLNEFTLINTPAALKLLTLPSLSGISNLIEDEEGISFLNGEVTYFEDPDTFSKIQMFGVSDSIGLVMEGDINRKDKSLNFESNGEILTSLCIPDSFFKYPNA